MVTYVRPSLLKGKEALESKTHPIKYKIQVVKRICITQRRPLQVFTGSNDSFISNSNWVDNLISWFAAD